MGFFKDFKDDMKQAVNELMPGNDEMVNEYDDEDMVNTLEDEDAEAVTSQKEAAVAGEEDSDDLDLSGLEDIQIDEEDLQDPFEEEQAMPEQKEAVSQAAADTNDIAALVDLLTPKTEEAKTEDKKAEDTKAEEAEAEKAETAKENTSVPPVTEEAVQNETKAQEESHMAEDKIIELSPKAEQEEPKMEVSAAPVDDGEVSDSTTYITKGTRIEGNLFTDGSVDIIGTVEGDVNCYGKLIVSGGINGKVNASEVYANAAKITGEIVSTGSVKIGVGSVIIGNIEAQSAVIAGAINGDLDVKGPVIVDSTAVIMGNIKSRSVQINNGAVIEGFCSQCYSDIDVKSFFA